MASVYMLRAYIRAMHNRTGPAVTSYEMSIGDGAVLVPLVAVILFFALYPQLALHKGERAVTGAIRPAALIAHAPPASASGRRTHIIRVP